MAQEMPIVRLSQIKEEPAPTTDKVVGIGSDGKAKLMDASGDAPVESVNGKTGEVVLSADDIQADNAQSIQSNLERIDLEVEGLVDDVADLNAGKLAANKAAVSAVGGLVTPTTTPTATELVGVGADGAQKSIEVGDGLTIDNNVLSASGGGQQEGISYNIPVSELTALFHMTGVGTRLHFQYTPTSVNINTWFEGSTSGNEFYVYSATLGNYKIYYLGSSISGFIPRRPSGDTNISAGVYKYYTYNVNNNTISERTSPATYGSNLMSLCVNSGDDRLIVGIEKIST